MTFSHAIAWTDGANMPHAEVKHAGAGAVVHLMDAGGGPARVLEWGRYLGSQSNQVAELCGIELAVCLAAERAPGVPLAVWTDSQYCEGLFTWCEDRGRWAFKARANAELVERVRAAVKALPRFSIRWVRGHNNDTWNERADRVAVWAKEHRQDWRAEYWSAMDPPPLPAVVSAECGP